MFQQSACIISFHWVLLCRGDLPARHVSYFTLHFSCHRIKWMFNSLPLCLILPVSCTPHMPAIHCAWPMGIYCTGWPFNVFKTSRWPYNKTQLSNQCQREVFKKLNGHPVCTSCSGRPTFFLPKRGTLILHKVERTALFKHLHSKSSLSHDTNVQKRYYIYIPTRQSLRMGTSLMSENVVEFCLDAETQMANK